MDGRRAGGPRQHRLRGLVRRGLGGRRAGDPQPLGLPAQRPPLGRRVSRGLGLSGGGGPAPGPAPRPPRRGGEGPPPPQPPVPPGSGETIIRPGALPRPPPPEPPQVPPPSGWRRWRTGIFVLAAIGAGAVIAAVIVVMVVAGGR